MDSGYKIRQDWNTSLRTTSVSSPFAERILRNVAGKKARPFVSILASILPKKRMRTSLYKIRQSYIKFPIYLHFSPQFLKNQL